MNQKKYYLLLALLVFPDSALAQNFTQGNFAAQANHSGSWVAPNTNQPNHANVAHAHFEAHPASTAQLNQPISFPEQPVSFESQVQNLEIENAKSFDSSLDSAAATVSKWKDVVSNKSSELLSKFNLDESGWLGKAKSIFGGADIGRMLGSLSLVLGGYFAFVWTMRKFGLSGNKHLPTEVVEVVGNAPFGPKQNLQLVRLGSKLLLLMNGPEGTHPIGEITDPAEVDHLTSLCTNRKRTAKQAQASTPASTSATQTILKAADRLEQASASNQNRNLTEVLRLLDSAKSGGALFEA